MKKLYANYIENYKGLSKEIWLLSLVTFINRAGAMVIPFLSLYLIKDLGFTRPQVGWIMTCYGLGALTGTWIGGKLTDQVGFYKVIISSLFLGGIGFILIQYVSTLYGFCIAVFALMLIADSYRPAVFVAIEAYSTPKTVTRAVALIRLAINLGFSIGPLLGGLIIAGISYDALFWIDGLSCMVAAIAMIFLIKQPQITPQEKNEPKVKYGTPVHKNPMFLFFFVLMLLSGLTFVQYFSLVPVYYDSEYGLSEAIIGGLLFLNGAMIVVLEMPLVGWLERKMLSKTMAMTWGMIFLAASFLILNMGHSMTILIIGMILMTFGEMIGSPFSNALALEMAPKGRKGSYMGLFSMSWAFSHVIGHNSGMNLTEYFGFETTWYLFALLLVFVTFGCLLLHKKWQKSTTLVT
jgi:predicted MFS family arabinose efflux permease